MLQCVCVGRDCVGQRDDSDTSQLLNSLGVLDVHCIHG